MSNEMNNKESNSEAVYLPSNEPYMGRESVFHFDNVIITCLETNANIVAYTHRTELSELQ